MRLFIAMLVGLITFNAVIFIALYVFRRPRPEMRTRLSKWVLPSSFGGRSRSKDHSHHPA
jgi:hypothetical protein